MNFSSAIFLLIAVGFGAAADCPSKRPTSKIVCYYSKLTHVDSCKCSHVILPSDSDVKTIDRVKERLNGVKILITVNEFNQGLVDILKSSKVDGIEINLRKLDSKNDISDFISTVRSKLGSNLFIGLSVPSKAEILAKYYDFKSLSKNADLFILQTSFLGASKNVTFHPSRLSGLWDMQNTDSVVDLVNGLGAPLSKVVITAPVQAFKFKLQSEKHTAPGGPALEVQSVTRNELCEVIKNGANWTLERDQDQTGAYIFSKDQWIAFDDATSIDIKAKYARVRGLAGMALKDVSQDGGVKCESSILEAAFNGLSKQARAPRGAVLHSLEREILDTSVRPLDSIQVSPYRVSRVIDVKGTVHVIRKDTRTEFECSRQGYFVHPRSCGRFYRCVKFDQLSDEFSVFEFDCPAGLAFDSRVEVCVWPGSLPHASPCSGSSEIAPVPRERFICPTEPGYYADPENCRWFFACLDHGKSPLSAYEFRCPFGLVYDDSRLLCEWPWLVPKCASGYAIGSQVTYTGGVAIDQYDGLGTLALTTLGGLQGPLQPQVAKIYTNVGLTSINNGHYQIGNGKLSLKAVQSLQNAGLLKNLETGNIYGVGLGYGDSAVKVDGSGSVHSQFQQHINGLDLNSGLGSVAINSGLYEQSGGSLINDQSGSNYQGGTIVTKGAGAGNVNLVNGAVENVHFGTNAHLVNGLADNLQIGINSASNYGTGVGGITNIIGGGYSVVGPAAASFGAGTNTVNHVTASPIGVASIASVPTVTAVPVPALKVDTNFESYNGGVVANVPELQYKVNSGVAQGVLIGSTPSTVIAQDGYHYNKPTVGFVEGGVKTTVVQPAINVVKPIISTYQKPSVSFVEQKVVQPVIVSSTQTPVVVEKIHLQPAVATVNVHQPVVSTVNVQHQPVVSTVNLRKENSFVGYNYPKPNIKFEETPIKTNTFTSYQNVDVQHNNEAHINLQPAIATVNVQHQPVVSTVNLQHQPAVSTVNLQKETSFVGYDYPKPSIKFEETPIKTNTFTSYQNVDFQHNNEAHINLQPAVATVNVHQPAVATFNVQHQPAVATVNVQHQPAVATVNVQHQPAVATFNVQHQPAVSTVNLHKETSFVGYDYPKPSIKFEETPIKTNTFTSYQNVVQQQPAITTLNVQHQPAIAQVNLQKETSFVGYDYPKPTIKFEETPIKTYQNVDLQHSTVYQKPAVTFKQIVQPQVTLVSSTPATIVKPAVTFTNFQRHEVVQPQIKVTSYNTPTPIIVEQKPQVYVSSTPATIVQPIVKQQPALTFNNYQQHKAVEQPAVTFTNYQQEIVQPQIKVVSSTPATVINYQNHEVVQPQIYSVPSSTIRPIITPAVVSKFSISSNSDGYHYQKPVIPFEEKPVVLNYQQPKISYKAPAVSTYNYKNVLQSTVNQGYSYPKPAIAFEEIPKRPAVISTYNVVTPTPKPVVVVPQTTYISSTPKSAIFLQPSTVKTIVQPVQPVVLKKQPEVVSSYSFEATPVTGYNYPKPVVPFVEEPRPVISYENRQPVEEPLFVAKKAYVTGQQIKFEQKPVVVENYQPVVVSTTPKYVQQEYNTRYQYNNVKLEENYQPQVVISSTPKYVERQQYNIDSGYQFNVNLEKKPVVQNYQPVIVSTTPKYVERQQYSVNSGYVYEKPKVVFEERPQFVHKVVTSTSRPIIDSGYQFNVNLEKKPVVVENYQPIRVSTTPKYVEKQQYSVNSGYVYEKPKVVFEEGPQFVQKVATSTSRPIIDSGYQFNVNLEKKPVVVENYQPVIVPTTAKYVERQQYSVNSGYVYEKPKVVFEEGPQFVQKVATSTSRPIVDYTYIQSTPKPTLISTIKTIVEAKQPFTYYDSRLKSHAKPVVYSTALPIIEEVSTSKPISQFSFGSFDTQYQEISNADRDYVIALQETKPQLVPVSTSRPIVKYSFSSLDAQYQPGAKVVESYAAPELVEPVVQVTSLPEPLREYLPVRNRVRVTTAAPELIIPSTEYVPLRNRVRIVPQETIKVTPSLPEPTREYLPVRNRVRVTTAAPELIVPSTEYLPVRNRVRIVPQKTIKVTTSLPEPTREYLPVRNRVQIIPQEIVEVTSLPTREYLPVRSRVKVTTAAPELIIPSTEYEPVRTRVKVTTPAQEYLPVRNRVRVTTNPPSREYLPVRSKVRVTTPTIEEYEEVSTRRPVKVVKVVRPKTIVKVNDFHPLLAAKLGAQCTCVSNTVKLRKKPLKIIVDDDDDDDGYIVDDDNNNDVVVENYEYEPQKLDIEPNPEIIISSTAEPLETSSTPVYIPRKRVRVRPATSTVVYDSPTEETAILVKKPSIDVSQVNAIRADELSSRRVTYKEALQSKNFDRYGPGGWRSKNEKLQGTIDCQRAGLFRHPSQCNKFYTCRWDCTKNRYTLHVFNCPVHLTFDNNLGACNWPSQGPACLENTLLPSD